MQDRIVQEYFDKEAKRQNEGIELIASENYPSINVREAQASIFTAKYAEGYPGHRYYGGCENVDVIENLAIERAKKLFKAASEEFQTFVPKVPEKLLENIPVTGGEKLECELELETRPLVIIKRGISPQLKDVSQTSETLTAPVRKGQVCVQYTLEYNNSPVCTVNIVAKDNIEKMNWLLGVKKLIYNLLKL